jgi:hypothetical protein
MKNWDIQRAISALIVYLVSKSDKSVKPLKFYYLYTYFSTGTTRIPLIVGFNDILESIKLHNLCLNLNLKFRLFLTALRYAFFDAFTDSIIRASEKSNRKI